MLGEITSNPVLSACSVKGSPSYEWACVPKIKLASRKEQLPQMIKEYIDDPYAF